MGREVSGQVIDNLRKIIFAALSATLDHVANHLGPSIARQPAPHYDLRSVTSAANPLQRFFARSSGKLLILFLLVLILLILLGLVFTLLIVVLLRVILPVLAMLGFLRTRAYAKTAS